MKKVGALDLPAQTSTTRSDRIRGSARDQAMSAHEVRDAMQST